jgi:hypothetical protein
MYMYILNYGPPPGCHLRGKYEKGGEKRKIKWKTVEREKGK